MGGSPSQGSWLSEHEAQGEDLWVHQLRLLQGCTVLPAASPLLGPHMAQLLRKQSFGESVHPGVTFQEPLISALMLAPTLPPQAGP